CYRTERIQPLKQVFRELYPLTEAERRDGSVSHRYAGQQAHWRQGMALLGQRGWVADMEEGDATRTFHERGLTASLGGIYGGDALTLESVRFHRAGDPWSKDLALVDVPPLVFSEVMRDLDLVVSVAHRGGVDPESSASTVEMRAALLREVCALLGLENVRLESGRAIIQGGLSQYSVHLGGGTTHLLPGGALCIVPVHEQQRGRIFLPFADDDPGPPRSSRRSSCWRATRRSGTRRSSHRFTRGHETDALRRGFDRWVERPAPAPLRVGGARGEWRPRIAGAAPRCADRGASHRVSPGSRRRPPQPCPRGQAGE
ncbi:MAG: DUF4132 domain-containing protein, partial [Ktedonobacterales bacterium]